MIPCENCIVLAICKTKIIEEKQKYERGLKELIEMTMNNGCDFVIKYRQYLLSQQSINDMIDSLANKCSLLKDYVRLMNPEKQYSKIRDFFQCEPVIQQEYHENIEVV